MPAGQVILQKGETLGDRERAIFADLFRRGARQVVLIGSDIPLITSRVLEEAFAALDASPSPVVLGPASDGGYYLLGYNEDAAFAFVDMPWSTDAVFGETVRRFALRGIRPAVLPELADVDTPEDLEQWPGFLP